MPAPFYPNDPEFRELHDAISRGRERPDPLFGGVARTPAGARSIRRFCSIAEGEIVDRYDKIKLVPFGEFVPEPFGWVNRITHEIGDFVPGTRIVIFDTGYAPHGRVHLLRIGVPGSGPPVHQGGADVLVNLSNDGYFGHSAAREQHLELVRMRAAENRALDSARHQRRHHAP